VQQRVLPAVVALAEGQLRGPSVRLLIEISRADALLVWLNANSPKDAITTRQTAKEARRSTPASEESTRLE